MTVVQTTPNTVGYGRVDPVANDFDVLVYQHGVDVIIESALICPCKMDGRGHLPSCKNCGGMGKMWINPVKTRMVLQSMNLSTKFKEWSQERVGMVNITARTVDPIGDMDRITVLNTISTMSEVLRPKIAGDGDFMAYTNYPISDVLEVYKFMGAEKKHKLLTKGADYTFDQDKNILRLNHNYNNNDGDTSVTIRYRHPIQYYIVDIPREVRQVTVENDLGQDQKDEFPISAVGRRTHYVIRPADFNGETIFDNSYK